MHKYAFLEPEQRCARIAVVFILVFCVFDILPGHRIFQLCGGDRKAVERENGIDALLAPWIELDLAGDAQNVLFIRGNGLRIHATGRAEGGEDKGLPKAFEAMAQDMKRAFGGLLVHQGIEQNGFSSIALEIDEPLPLFGLGKLDVVDHIARKQRALSVKLIGTAFNVTTPAHLEIDGVLETALDVFAAIAHAAASFSANPRTPISPATPLVMTVDRYPC